MLSPLLSPFVVVGVVAVVVRYDAFMTNYSSFDVQLRQRKQQNEQSRLISKKLYSLGVKMARDITSTCYDDR